MSQTFKPRVLLIHWNREEAETRAGLLRELGFNTRVEVPEGPPFFKRLQIDPPDCFENSLGPLPDGVKIVRNSGPKRDLTLWFVRSKKELRNGLKRVLAASGEGRLWIAWPKRGSKEASDLTQQMVRDEGLAAGWVDYKICSINNIWSALLFTRRKRSVKRGEA